MSALERRIAVGLALALPLAAVVPQPAAAVDGVIEINDARAKAGGVTTSDGVGYPVTIDHGGSYRLTGDLIVPDENTDGIDVAITSPAEVTIDLNGFSIRGPVTCSGTFYTTSCSPSGGGIGINFTGGTGTRLRVLNGTIRGVGSVGIRDANDNDVVAESLHIRDTQHGIEVDHSARVIDSEVENTLYDGIKVGTYSLVRGCTVRFTGADGILVGSGSFVTSCISSLNGASGIEAPGSNVTDNTAFFNQGYGLNFGTVGSAYSRNYLSINNLGSVSASVNNVQTTANSCNGNPC